MASPKIRCAIYTRKSSEDGLDQDFNSLDAQYEACSAYITSQKHEGWRLVKNRYDDGGISGGTLKRDGLIALLEDIKAGLVDRIVVYKIDRLTRSLSDFSKIVDQLDAANASFVSVTQSFNTATSMGRLTLNMLLSFAQFEREMTGERIRDKIAASKKKGLWMGGNTPLGYDADPDPNCRILAVNEAEALSVKTLFDLYDSYGCLRSVMEQAKIQNIRSKKRISKAGNSSGGAVLTRGQIHHIFTNPVYCGKIRHKDTIWPGQHCSIIDQSQWDRIQQKLQEASARKRGQHISSTTTWLVGKSYDETGDRLTPTHTNKNGRRISYMISNRLIRCKDPSGWRLPTPKLEDVVINIVVEHLEQAAKNHTVLALPCAATAGTLNAKLHDLIILIKSNPSESFINLLKNIKLSPNQIEVELSHSNLGISLGVSPEDLSSNLAITTSPLKLQRRGVELKLIAGTFKESVDPRMKQTLSAAHLWLGQIKDGVPVVKIANQENISESYLRAHLPLAFLSPKIQRAILSGSHPVHWTPRYFVKHQIPTLWDAQARRYPLSA